MGLGEGKRFALHHKAMKGFFFLFFSVVGLLCSVLILLLAMCLPHELTFSAELSVWVARGELLMKPWCTICLLLTLVAVLSDSFLQCIWRGKGHLIFVRIIPKGSGDGDEVLSVPPLHAPLQKAYKPFYWHLDCYIIC